MGKAHECRMSLQCCLQLLMTEESSGTEEIRLCSLWKTQWPYSVPILLGLYLWEHRSPPFCLLPALSLTSPLFPLLTASVFPPCFLPVHVGHLWILAFKSSFPFLCHLNGSPYLTYPCAYDLALGVAISIPLVTHSNTESASDHSLWVWSLSSGLSL